MIMRTLSSFPHHIVSEPQFYNQYTMEIKQAIYLPATAVVHFSVCCKMLDKVLCLLVLCSALGHCASVVSGQSWRPAGPRDLSQYRPAPAVIEDTRDVRASAHYKEKKVELKLESTQTGLKSFDAICGLENVVDAEQERIIGGSEAAPNQWPWQVRERSVKTFLY